MITAGAALATFGGVLTALGGASAGAGQGGGASASSASPGFSDPNENIVDVTENERNRGTVTVNIQGNVLDSRESGLRIVELINESFNKDGARLVTA